jgi:predicted secreted Zn-dependent protease
VVDFLNANSPHRATSGWAKTSASFGWDATPAYSGSGSATTAEVTNPSVTKSVRVDMPSWAPTDPAMAGAWSGMTRDLRAHEARHEGIASTWESTLRTNLGGLSVTVPNRTNDAFTAAVRRPWNGWIAEHQADQNAIDPFSALLDCGGGDSESGGGAAPDLGPDLDAEPDLGD